MIQDNTIKSKIKSSICLIALISLIGFSVDPTNGFYLLEKSKNIIGGVFAINVFGALYLVGEMGVDYLNLRDDIASPRL